MTNYCQIAIIGAGPYGLSIAAHLRDRGIDFRIFGAPMHTWREQMPKGMLLKSDGFASNLSDPRALLTLRSYCGREGIPYDDTMLPVRLDTFTAYGLAFQKLLVPELEERQVTALDQSAAGFRLQLDNGEMVHAKKVLSAVGITNFQYLPPNLGDIPREFLSHSSAHHDLAPFRGRVVTVIGSGASAVDVAGLLQEQGAEVTIVGRRPALRFHEPPLAASRSLWQRIRRPASGIGPGVRSRFFTDAPVLFHRLPQDLRLRTVKAHLGPAAGWTMKERIAGRVQLLMGRNVQKAGIRAGRIHLTLSSNGQAGTTRADETNISDHVIAATGYRVDLRRLSFLSEAIRSRISEVENTPILTSSFESSVPGLYFAGPAAANSFGPLLRFAFGSAFAARRLAEHLSRSTARESLPGFERQYKPQPL